MAEFREAVLSMCWLTPTLAAIFFWVVSLTSFLASRSDGLAPQSNGSCMSPSPSPSASDLSCDLKELRTTMVISTRWMAACAISGILVLYYVRWFVESKEAIEKKEASIEDEPRKAARDALREAQDAVQVALKLSQAQPTDANLMNNYVDAVGTVNSATCKVVMLGDSKEGLARLPGGGLWARSIFCLGILLNLAMGYFAAVAYYYSLRLQSGCDDGAAAIAPFAAVGMLAVLIHLHALRVAITSD